MTVVEICVEDAAGVALARDGGADRVELCRELTCGGLTPDFGMVEQALQYAPLGGMQVLVRPRPGDFVHTPEEIERIAADIRALAVIGEGARIPVGFVVGVLGQDGTINRDAAQRLREEADEAPLTFHRAFDCVTNQEEALEELMNLGYDRILTTGGDQSVAQPQRLRKLANMANDRLIILVSGGLRAHNVAAIARQSEAREVHMRAPAENGSSSSTDGDEVRRIMAALGRGV
ncbi:copper homeostasis protein CutC [Schaalia vaccimaxillae]|uniref:copper homeostasis protein CutC n=1 Tax=Schaalia vaccimaxillae TaxID=183916 RepID=UPI0003B75961|nr:copper homeostasis protein CutC [Schaalia vaccimaxillae]